jgi:hypothetical protein
LQIELQIIQKDTWTGVQHFNLSYMSLVVDTSNWEAGKDYPEWMNEVSIATISKGYLLPNETPKLAYRRVASTVARKQVL